MNRWVGKGNTFFEFRFFCVFEIYILGDMLGERKIHNIMSEATVSGWAGIDISLASSRCRKDKYWFHRYYHCLVSILLGIGIGKSGETSWNILISWFFQNLQVELSCNGSEMAEITTFDTQLKSAVFGYGMRYFWI